MSASANRARLSRVERPAGIAARLFSMSPLWPSHMQVGQGLDGGAAGGIDVPQRDQVVGQGPRLVAGPGVERGDELRLLDQAGLQGQQAEEEMAVGSHGSTPVGLRAPASPSHHREALARRSDKGINSSLMILHPCAGSRSRVR